MQSWLEAMLELDAEPEEIQVELSSAERAAGSIGRCRYYALMELISPASSTGPALPPSVQRNLARGKPLPPGIAKKLDGRLIGHLPHYQGYEWMQVGVDLVLVAAATGIVYEVLNGTLN